MMPIDSEATVKPVKSEAFFDIPLNLIIIEEQIRSRIDAESESFKSLVESIREKGVLEPVLVTPKVGLYLLISGERRFLACRTLNYQTIPARVLDAVEAKEEILAIQLTENLQRENLDPMDEANALFAFMKEKHPALEIDGMMNAFVQYNRDQGKLEKNLSTTVVGIANISGKSVTSLHRGFSLLKLPEEIKSAVKDGTIGVSQGYIFAANLDNPGLMETFKSILEKPVINASLESKLASFTKKKRDLSGMKPKPFEKFYLSMKSVKSQVKKNSDRFQKSDLEKLLTDLRALTALLEQIKEEAASVTLGEKP
jgi:ParB-like chromosome segregation protein Spo0J